jgi:undecaprenyl-diphosphatase
LEDLRTQGDRARGTHYPETGRHKRILLAVGIAALLVPGGLFLAIAEDVATADPLVVVDARVANWLHAHATAGLTQFFLQVSLLHGVAAICVYTAALAAFLAMQRDWYWVPRVALIVPTGMLFNVVLKEAYQRIRPSFDHPLIVLTTYSFPSGHTAGATLFYGIFAVVLFSRLRSPVVRAAFFAIAALLVTLVAFSRMYLGAHYLSDVVAAACASVAWTAFGLIALPRFLNHPEHLHSH